MNGFFVSAEPENIAVVELQRGFQAMQRRKRRLLFRAFMFWIGISMTYAFTAPAVNPCTKYFCRKRLSKIGGMVYITADAMMKSHDVLYSPK